MCERFPERADSDAAREGTASHWVASEVLVGRGAEPFTGRTAPNGVIITEEMASVGPPSSSCKIGRRQCCDGYQ
jgi:hypothetical protein